MSAGLEEEGLYRKPGVLSKATRLVKDSVERGKLESLNLRDEFEWDTKTIASAVKGYFSKHLGEPLLTFDLHMQFVDAASESASTWNSCPGGATLSQAPKLLQSTEVHVHVHTFCPYCKVS